MEICIDGSLYMSKVIVAQFGTVSSSRHEAREHRRAFGMGNNRDYLESMLRLSTPLANRALWRSCSHCEVFLVSLMDRALARNFMNEFPHHSIVAAHSARATADCGLSSE